MNVPLSTPQTIAVLRTRYPDALVCVECGRLLTTERHRFIRLTNAEAAAYVCEECRWEAGQAAKAKAVRVETGRRNLALARAGRPERIGIEGASETLFRTPAILRGYKTANSLQRRLLRQITSSWPTAGSAAGGSPKTKEAQRQGRRESQRRWRAKQNPATGPA